MRHPKLEELVEKDPRYPFEAYEFIYEALAHTQQLLGRVPSEEPEDPENVPPSYHVTGPELVRGICDLARREMGLMARVVFRLWGINETLDFGNLVFNLIDAELMSRTEGDRLEDFADVCDLDEVLVRDYKITTDEDN